MGVESQAKAAFPQGSRSRSRSQSRRQISSSSSSSSTESSSCQSATATLNEADKRLLTTMVECQLTRRQLLALAERMPFPPQEDARFSHALVIVRAGEGCWAVAQILDIEKTNTYRLKKERRPAKKRDFDWKLRVQRGSDEKIIKVGSISNRKVDRDHMRNWKFVAGHTTDDAQDGMVEELQQVSRRVHQLKQQLPYTGTPRSTPRSDPAPPSEAALPWDGQRCGSETKEPYSYRSEASTPAETNCNNAPEAEQNSDPLEAFYEYSGLLEAQNLLRDV